MEKLQDSSQELLIESHSIAIKLEPCNSNSESNETKKKKKCKQSTTDQDMVNMFASVWVKVEVDEDGSNTENVMEDAVNTIEDTENMIEDTENVLENTTNVEVEVVPDM